MKDKNDEVRKYKERGHVVHKIKDGVAVQLKLFDCDGKGDRNIMEKMTVNGFTVFYHNNGMPLTSVRAIVNAGNAHEHDDEYGYAHFLEHMFFKGTVSKTPKEIKTIGARLGYLNGYTDDERTVYYVTTRSVNLEEALGLMTEMVFEPRFDPEEFEKERGVIFQELNRSHDNPTYHFWYGSQELFAGPRGHHPIGRKATIENATIGGLKDFRKRLYTSETVCFGIVGDVSKERVVKFFEGLKAPDGFVTPLERVMPDFKANYTPRSFYHNAKQATIGLMTQPQVTKLSLEEKAVRKLVINGAGGDMHSLLFQRIREELGFCYHIHMYQNVYSDVVYSMVFAQLEKENIPKAHEEMLKILKQIKTEGFSDELLRTSKENELFDMASAIETSQGFGRCVFDAYELRGWLFDYKVMEQHVNNVSNEDIVAMANRMFPDDEMVLLAMTDEAEDKLEEFA